MTLRTRLTVAFVLVVLVPLLVGGLLVTRAFPRANATRQAETASAASRLLATVVAGYCERARATAEAAGRATAGQAGPQSRRAVEDLVTRGLADGVRVVSATGAPLAFAGSVPPIARSGDCSAGDPGREPFITSVVYLSTADGQEAGVAVAAFRVDNAFVERLQAATGNGEVALLDGQRVVASSGDIDSALIGAALTRPRRAVTVHGDIGWTVPPREGQPYAVLVALP